MKRICCSLFTAASTIISLYTYTFIVTMSTVTSSGIQRHRQHAYEVGTNKHNKYGLQYGYSVNPDPSNPYGWQAYEAERARQKKHAEMQRQMQRQIEMEMEMAAGRAPVTASSNSSASSTVCTSSVSESSCPTEKKKKKEKKNKGKCSGAACRRKSLRVRRPGPHWCDGKKWGGKIWGMTRDPGDVRIQSCLVRLVFSSLPPNIP